MQNTSLQILGEWILGAKRLVFFGGAGVSTESGIPDFRSQNGLYHQTYRYPPEHIISHSFFKSNTQAFYEFYTDCMIAPDAQPNAAHMALARLEARGKLHAIVTQNIDGLHQMAGSKQVFELHGSVHRNFCMDCHKAYPLSFIQDAAGIPYCNCGGVIKPDVVLYEETLDETTVQRSIEVISQADVLIIGGTSLMVYPAASLIRYYKGSRLVLINRDATPADAKANLVIHDLIGRTLSELPI